MLGESHLVHQVELVEHAVLQDRVSFRRAPAGARSRAEKQEPSSSAIGFALEYGKAHLIPLLTPVSPLRTISPTRPERATSRE